MNTRKNTRTNGKSAVTDNMFEVIDLDVLSPAEEAYADQFDSRLIGQPDARQLAIDIRARYRNPLRDRSRPIGIYYLVGKSRRGKSLLAQVLAEMFHGNKEALTRVTAEDYYDDSQMTDLMGASPKYVGFRDPVNAYKLEPEKLAQVDGYSKVSEWNRLRVRMNSREVIDIVVIEEMEKAGYDFYKFWMEAFDKGKKRLGNGELCDFTNTVFIITSNLGMDRVEKEEAGGIGFNSKAKKLTHEQIVSVVQQEMQRRYKPEFRNRLDAVVVYRELTEEHVRQILNVEINRIQDRIIDQMPRASDFTLEVDESAREFLFNAAAGEVADLKRALFSHLETPMGRLLDRDNPQRVMGGDLVRVSWDGKSDKLRFAIARGEGDFAEGVEGMDLFGGETPESARGMALQRRVQKARMRARRAQTREWVVLLTAPSLDELQEASAELIHDLQRVFELEVTDISLRQRSPYTLSLLVVATDEQMGLVRQHFPDIAANPTEEEQTA